MDFTFQKEQRIAKRFHELYEKSAPFFGYKTRDETKIFDPDSANGRLMIYVCHRIIEEEKDRIFELAKDHYWDSLAKNKDIIDHLKKILV